MDFGVQVGILFPKYKSQLIRNFSYTELPKISSIKALQLVN